MSKAELVSYFAEDVSANELRLVSGDVSRLLEFNQQRIGVLMQIYWDQQSLRIE